MHRFSEKRPAHSFTFSSSAPAQAWLLYPVHTGLPCPESYPKAVLFWESLAPKTMLLIEGFPQAALPQDGSPA